MNCKPGIMAVVVNANLPEEIAFLGVPCEVLLYYGTMTKLNTGEIFHMWHVSFPHDMPWEDGMDTDGVWPDEWLRPIKPSEETDSVLAEAPIDVLIT